MDSSPTALFDSYEQDFQLLIESIQTKLAGDDVGEQKKAALRRAEMDLDEADEMVSQMEIELQSIPTSLKSSYSPRLRTAKSQLQTSKKSLVDARTSLSRAELLASKPATLLGSTGGDYSSDDPYSTSDRSRLLAGTTLLESGTKRLQDSQRIALETEEQGSEILRNLRTQREQIENSRDTLYRADSTIDRASGTLKKMIRRMYQQRAMTYAIIIILILLIIVVVWGKLSN